MYSDQPQKRHSHGNNISVEKNSLWSAKEKSTLYIFFWVFPRRQIVVGRRFGTLYQFHLQRLGVHTLYTQPLKMELIQGSETSANYNLTPGKYPKENIQYSNHGESLKSRKGYLLPVLKHMLD